MSPGISRSAIFWKSVFSGTAGAGGFAGGANGGRARGRRAAGAQSGTRRRRTGGVIAGAPASVSVPRRTEWNGARGRGFSRSPELTNGAFGPSPMPTVYITRTVHFNAAHRLHNPAKPDAWNRETFGRCNNPNWH